MKHTLTQTAVQNMQRPHRATVKRALLKGGGCWIFDVCINSVAIFQKI